MKVRKCPKCGKLPGYYFEIWTGHRLFDAENGIPSTETDDADPGDPTHVVAGCDNCGHEWRLRGVIQITELMPDY